jgi:pyrroloquinoline quinone biosynthesis protein E
MVREDRVNDVYICSREVKLRRESFGGIAFHKKRALAVELDKPAFNLIKSFKHPLSISQILESLDGIQSTQVKEILLKFIHYKIIVRSSANPVLFNPEKPKSGNCQIAGERWLCAPETVHLSITGKCNFTCPSCYRLDTDKELTTQQIFELIDQLASLKVFQLAIGGGEPLLRKDIFEILAHSAQRGIVANLTTNGSLITKTTVKHLSNFSIGQINISLNGHSETTNFTRGRFAFLKATQAIKLLKASPLRIGVNLLVTPENLPHLEQILSFIDSMNIRYINILRPKPTKNNTRWYQSNKLLRKHLGKLKSILISWQDRLCIAVDSALVCLMSDLSAYEMQKRGIYGCSAGKRICSVDPSGKVYPCSFLTWKDFLAGDVKLNPFIEIWREAEVFKLLRNTWEKLRGRCGSCSIKNFCGGARCIVFFEGGDLFAEDRQCILNKTEDKDYEDHKFKGRVST